MSVTTPETLFSQNFRGEELTLSDLDVGGEVHHGVRLMLAEGGVQIFTGANVSAHQGPPLHGVLVAGGEIVEGDGDITARGERLADVGADIAGAADDQNFHGFPPGPRFAHRLGQGAAVASEGIHTPPPRLFKPSPPGPACSRYCGSACASGSAGSRGAHHGLWKRCSKSFGRIPSSRRLAMTGPSSVMVTQTK